MRLGAISAGGIAVSLVGAALYGGLTDGDPLSVGVIGAIVGMLVTGMYGSIWVRDWEKEQASKAAARRPADAQAAEIIESFVRDVPEGARVIAEWADGWKAKFGRPPTPAETALAIMQSAGVTDTGEPPGALVS
jgi:hypothetical protein